ncbi:MAG: hypothetical protein GEV10_01010 [Streptosporangiales bacterium]|nr:hypothetical protein [Streptosporangiales bacterium]
MPVVTQGGQDWFDVEEVVAWLERTGLGNNDSVRDDAMAYVSLGGSSRGSDAQSFAGLTALLCVKVITGEALTHLSAEALLDLADDLDPDDTYLYTELEALDHRLEPLARYADLYTSAAYNPVDAFEKLVTEHFRRHVRGQAVVDLAWPARALAAATAVALAADAGQPTSVFVDPTPGGSDLLVSVARALGEDATLTTMTAGQTDPASRLACRRLCVHDIVRAPLEIAEDGSFEVQGPAVFVAQYPPPAEPEMPPGRTLDAIDQIVLQMDDTQRAVVLAPAPVLSDRPTGRELDELRAGILRSGRVRAVVRLPRGLVPSKSRQSLALWVLGRALDEVAIADRWTMVGDLVDVDLTAEGVTDDLVTDLAAATHGWPAVRAHAFRFLRRVSTSTLLAGGGELVAQARVPRKGDPAPSTDLVVRAISIRDRLAAGAYDSAAPTIAIAARDQRGQRPPPGMTVLGQAIADGRIHLIGGNRVDPTDLRARAGHRVLGPAELTMGAPARFIDRMVFASKYPAGRLSESGDVVFCTSPRPAALVDHAGASVVVSPARILRIRNDDPGGHVANVLSADINALPVGAKTWKTWQVRRVPDEQIMPLVDALDDVQRHRAALADRMSQLDELADLITQGATTGSLDLRPPATSRKGQ